MNKIYVTLYVLLIAFVAKAQCNFQIIDFQQKKMIATPKTMIATQENEKSNKASYLLFSLFTDGEVNKVLTTFSQVAPEQLQKVCFTNKAKLVFTLKDASKVTLSYNGYDICQEQKKHPTKKAFNTLKTETLFLIDKAAYLNLKKQKITKVSLITGNNQKFPFDITKRIEDVQINDTAFPALFFMNNLDCLK
ncbi:hypothetical protein [Aquimarina agarivorans]|uniref:hypothetical protein n=1 Tax=Aquimarina agarivorans TaxID=980584 RepID=UPI000248E79B|nr:hypothetical protein [Aquimarina agarivorans]